MIQRYSKHVCYCCLQCVLVKYMYVILVEHNRMSPRIIDSLIEEITEISANTGNPIIVLMPYCRFLWIIIFLAGI